MYETLIASRESELPIDGSAVDHETINRLQNKFENSLVLSVDSLKEFVDYKNKDDISKAICTFSRCLIKIILSDVNSNDPQEYVIYQYKDSKELTSWCKILDQEIAYENFVDFLKLRANEIIASRYLINQFSILEQIPLKQSCNTFIPKRIKILIPMLDESSSLQEMEFEIQTIWAKSSYEGIKVKVTCPKLDSYRHDAISNVSERLLFELSNNGFINLAQ